jgi:cytidylate kinase
MASPVIAIDGPSASGKGTVAKAVANALGFHFLDSGALYRLVALAALENAVPVSDVARVTEIAANLNVVFSADAVLLDGRDVTAAIREEPVGAAASAVAAIADVRTALLERQRRFRKAPGLVADGRDMGSVVFPDAALKVFLTADPVERARRRYKQLMEKGIDANIDTLLQEIRERDTRDSQRAAAPLRKCADAVELDTTSMSVDEAVAQVVTFYKKRAYKAP